MQQGKDYNEIDRIAKVQVVVVVVVVAAAAVVVRTTNSGELSKLTKSYYSTTKLLLSEN